MYVVTNITRRMFGAERQPGFPPVTGRFDRARHFTSEAEAQTLADELTATPNVRGTFRVVRIEA